MNKKIPLPWPAHGLSDDRAFAEQPPTTTGRARNVRLIDPKTRRSRGAQRAGMSRFWANTLGARIDHIAAVSYNAPKIQYELLTEVDNEETTPGLIEAEWVQTPGPGLVTAVRTDSAGTIYALTEDDRVIVYNQDGALLETIQVPVKQGEDVFRGLAVDEASRIYVAAVPAAGVNNGAPRSRVFMWRQVTDPDDDEFSYYDLAWTIETDGYAKELVARAGGLWVVRGGLTGESLEQVAKYGAIVTPLPIEEWALNVPSPCNDIAVGRTGQVYVSIGSNPARGALPGLGGLHVSNLRWTPHDLGYDADVPDVPDGFNVLTAGRNRLHAWVDTRDLPNVPYGAEVRYIADQRFRNTQNETPAGGQEGGSSANPDEYGDGPHDTTPRLFRKDPADLTLRRGPSAAQGAWANRPAVQFDRHHDEGTDFPGTAISSGANLSPNFKLAEEEVVDIQAQTAGADQTLITDFVTLPDLSIVVGAGYDTGSLRAHVTVKVRHNVPPPPLTFPPSIDALYLRVVRDGTFGGTEVLQSISAEDGVYTLELPVPPADSGGSTYTIQARHGVVSAVTWLDRSEMPAVFTLIHASTTPHHEQPAPTQWAVVPGHRAAEGHGDNYVHISTWRLYDTASGIQVLAAQNGNQHKWALLANAKIVGNVLAHEPGWIAFISNQAYGGATAVLTMPGNTAATQFLQGWRGLSQGTNIDGLNPGGYALVTVGISGITHADPLDTEDANTCFFRVNGTPAGRFTMDEMEAWGLASQVVLGNKHAHRFPSPDDLFPADIPFLPFHGLFTSWVTVLGSTSDPDVTANDEPTTFPMRSSDSLPPAPGAHSGSEDPSGYDTDLPNLSTSFTGSVTEVERLEGGLAHEWGIANLLPHGFGTGADAEGLFPDHPFGGATFPPTGFADPTPLDETGIALASTRPILAKIGSGGGGFRWALNGSALGWGCAADDDGLHVVTVGEKDPFDVTREDTVIRRIFDGGNTYSLDEADGAWQYDEPGFTPEWTDPQVILDGEGNAYWPRTEENELVKHSVLDGDRLFTFDNEATVRQVALDPLVPVYPPTVDDEDRVPVFCYLAGQSLRKLRLVAETQVIGDTMAARQTRYIAAAGADLWGGVAPIGGVPQAAAILTGGTGILDITRTFAASAQLFGKLYLTDGRNYYVFDPVKNEVEPYESDSRGEVPKRARLMEAWNGRLVLARTQDSDTTWFMSKQGDPENWDYFPPNPTVQDAVNADSAKGPGRAPDSITALVAFDDSTLIIGCDSSIFAMRGDPLGGMRLDSSQGGRLDQITDQTGMAFGRPTTRGPSGEIYFYGQRGGVYVLTEQGVERITEKTIEARLQSIDLSSHRVELAWDYRNEGLHLFQFEHAAEEPVEEFDVVVTKTWTLNADFDEGVLVNVNHTAVANQLQLDEFGASQGFLWVPTGTPRNSVCRVDIGTGEVIGEYRTNPDGTGGDPSRTYVDAEGNCWVGNRAQDIIGQAGSVTKVGLTIGGTRVDADGTPNPTGDYLQGPFTYSTAIDRDADDLIYTSRGLADVRDWPTGTDAAGSTVGQPAFVEDAEDECILCYQRTLASPNVRHIAVIGDDVYTYGYPFQPTGFDHLRTSDAARVSTGLLACGGYGGVVDSDGIVWSADEQFDRLLRHAPGIGVHTITVQDRPSGVAVEASGDILVAGGMRLHRYSNAGPPVLQDIFVVPGAIQLLGIVVVAPDDIWIADYQADRIWRMNASGALQSSIVTPEQPNGLSIDANGKVWVCYEGGNLNDGGIRRLHPVTGATELTVDLGFGAKPFSPSAMTGEVAAGGIVSPGSWTVTYDGGLPDIAWQTIEWTADELNGSTIVVEARVAAEEADLPDQTYVEMTDGGSIGAVGRYIEIRVTFTKGRSPETSPILYDLSILGVTAELPESQPSYFWDRKNVGWYEDTYQTAAVQPTAVAVFDGDRPDDRVVALGFGGGEVRWIDQQANTDDGIDIQSDIWIGPFLPGLPDQEYRFSHLQAVLGRDQGACGFEWYARNEPDIDFDFPGVPNGSGTWNPGTNPVNYLRARGLYVWLRVFGGTRGTSWAYEGASLRAEPGGRARVRN